MRNFFQWLWEWSVVVLLGSGALAGMAAIYWFSFKMWSVVHPGAPWWSYLFSN